MFIEKSLLNCVAPVVVCIFLAVAYVGSLYIWSNSHGRDHPTTIKKRSVSVACMSLMSAVVTYFFIDREYFENDISFWTLIGITRTGLLQAVVLPLILTMVLFLGPIILHYSDGMYSNFFDLNVWFYCATNVIWLRNHLIAPFFEEFTFRACMLPLLVPCFGSRNSVLLCPLFFGIAHLHLLREKIAQGMQIRIAVLQSLFQLAYTTVFGAYSSYLFLCTGHFSSAFVVHAFCNHMGFPDFHLLFTLPQPTKNRIIASFVIGLLSWSLLLKPLTDPSLYGSTIYWHH